MNKPNSTSQSTKFCARCGAEMKAGSRFCSSCGQALAFCSRCGAALVQGSRFCSQCGQSQDTAAQPRTPAAQPLAPAAAPAPPPAAATTPPEARDSEPVLFVIPYVEERAGLFRSNTYNLVFTARRMVLATVTSQMIQQAAKQAVDEAKQQGKGLVGRMGASMRSRKDLWERYLNMSLRAIMAEHPDNTFLPLSEISQIRIKQDDDEDNPADILTLKTTSGKREFTLKGCSGREAKKLLRQILEGKVR